MDEWLSLFDDPILGNSALDRLANASYQIVIEGTSYRGRLSPHRALLGAKGVIDPPTKPDNSQFTTLPRWLDVRENRRPNDHEN